MNRILPLALIALTLTGGVALADRDRGWRGRDSSHHQGGTVVTPTRGHDRGHDRGRRDDRRYDRHDNRRYSDRRWDNDRRDRVVRVQRSRPTFRNNRFYFTGGHYQSYQRPVIQYRYRNYYQRPALLVENIQPVSGYVWTQGNWQWDGYEWQWIAGRYEVDQSYQEPYYGDSYDSDNDDYDDRYYNGQGSVSVQGSWNF